MKADSSVHPEHELLSPSQSPHESTKLEKQLGNAKQTVDNFKPPIFWKDKAIVQKQIEIWSISKIYELFDEVNNLEISYKKNSEFSNNLVFDLIYNTSNS